MIACSTAAWLFALLEQAVERRTRVAGVSWRSDIRRGSGIPVRVSVAVGRGRMDRFACHRETRLEQRTLIGLVLHRDAYRYRLQALETSGRLKIRALLAAVQSRAALRAFAFEVDIGKKRGGAIETSCRRHRLHHARKPRAGDIDGRAWTLGAWAFLAPFAFVGKIAAARVLVAVLTVLTFAFHSYTFALR